MANTIQLAHVPMLSEQTFQRQGGNTVNVPWAIDNHAGVIGSGYYHMNSGQTPAEVLQNVEATIMNADSYSYLLALWRMRGKGWEDTRSNSGHITYGRNANLPDPGDW